MRQRGRASSPGSWYSVFILYAWIHLLLSLGLKQKSHKLEGEKKTNKGLSRRPCTRRKLRTLQAEGGSPPRSVQVHERRRGAEKAGKRILAPESKVLSAGHQLVPRSREGGTCRHRLHGKRTQPDVETRTESTLKRRKNSGPQSCANSKDIGTSNHFTNNISK